MTQCDLPDSCLNRRRADSLLETVPNPFSNPVPWTLYERVKAVLVCIFFLPMRLYILVICMVLEVMIARLAVVGTTLSEDRGCYRHLKPFAFWRRWIMFPLAPINRVALACLGYWPGAIKVNDLRKDKSNNANILVVAPHRTFIDSLLIATAFPPVPSGVGMSGILDMPVMRSLAIAGQTVFVDRDNAESRHSCKEAIQARASKDWTGPPMMIFPEGVLTNGDALVQFKVGAFSCGQPVTPVCLKYSWRSYNPSGVGRNGHIGMAILRMMLQFANYCEIDIMDTYVPSAAETLDPKVFASNVREIIAKQLRIPVTEHSYHDSVLAYEAKAHVGSDFEVASAMENYQYSFEDLKTLLKTFEKYDGKRTGSISYVEFQKALQSLYLGEKRNHGSAKQLFRFFDQDNSGAIEYREFIQVSALLSGKCSTASRTKLAFLVYDVAGEGKIRKDVLCKALNDSVAHPETQFCRQTSPGNRLLAGSDSEELDFEDFVQLAESQPEVLDSALDLLRCRLDIPSLGNLKGVKKNM